MSKWTLYLYQKRLNGDFVNSDDGPDAMLEFTTESEAKEFFDKIPSITEQQDQGCLVDLTDTDDIKGSKLITYQLAGNFYRGGQWERLP